MCLFAVSMVLGVVVLFSVPCCLGLECPLGCECFTSTRTVKCLSGELRTVPHGIPGHARTLVITGNDIFRLEPESFADLDNVTNVILSDNGITEVMSQTFSALTSLRLLDLSSNRLVLIHPAALSIPGGPLQELNLSRALHNATSLTDLTTALRWGGLRALLRLDLSGNGLVFLPPGMFSHLPSLRQLLLADNSLAGVYDGTFSGVGRLEALDLTGNAFRTFDAGTLRELGRPLAAGSSRVLLARNAYDCSCQIRDFVAWLNGSSSASQGAQQMVADVERVRCASPKALEGAQVRGLGMVAIGCEVPPHHPGGGGELDELSLQTSYVFLGLVLGFVGMVFILVLYLNRHGMKKWIVEMRDACQDVLEGYYYRYELDSDPRLGQVGQVGQVGHLAGGGRDTPQGTGHFGKAPSGHVQVDAEPCVVQMLTDTQLKQVTTTTGSPPGNL